VSSNGYTRSPKIQKGAFVQLAETLGIPLPNIVPFQFNPSKMTRSLKAWNPLQVDENNRGQLAPAAQPFDPEETITMTLELDAADHLEGDQFIANTFGIGDRIAALEAMLFAAQTPLGQLVSLAASLLTGAQPLARPTVPVTFLVWGIGRMVPVRITEYSIEEQMFLPSLRPIQASINIKLQVLTPESFKCIDTPSVTLAKAAYSFYRTQQTVLALLNIVDSADELLAILPF
jgi:hypothetical protein